MLFKKLFNPGRPWVSHLVLVGVTQNKAPLLHLTAQVVGRIRLYARPLDAVRPKAYRHNSSKQNQVVTSKDRFQSAMGTI